MLRQHVYDALDGERAYQESKWGWLGTARQRTKEQSNANLHQVGQWIVFMEHYLGLAKSALTVNEVPYAALHELRKVVALGIACFEQNGVPPRAS